jgi:protease II
VLSAGPGGPTGRFDRYRDIAFEFAFLLKLARKIPASENTLP